MLPKRKRGRGRLITGRRLLYLHFLIYVGVIFFIWWDFINALYGIGFFFWEAAVPIYLHAALTGLLAVHTVLYAFVKTMLNRRRARRLAQYEEDALAKRKPNYQLLWEEEARSAGAGMRKSHGGQGGLYSPSTQVFGGYDDDDDDLLLLEEYEAQQAAARR